MNALLGLVMSVRKVACCNLGYQQDYDRGKDQEQGVQVRVLTNGHDVTTIHGHEEVQKGHQLLEGKAYGETVKHEEKKEAMKDKLGLIDTGIKKIYKQLEKKKAEHQARIYVWKQWYDHISPNGHTKQHKYEMVQMIGRGSFGEVWEAKDEHHHDCAIKKMKMKIHWDAKVILSEISHLKECNHPNIPKYIDSFKVGQKEIWLIMEHIQGVDLSDLAFNTTLSPVQIATICQDVLSALAYLHNKNIIHRDVKGENIIVNTNGHAYLADLGLSILEGPDANTVSGTTRFMAPEVFAKKTYRCNVDVWSLGMTVVQMVTGFPPYYHVPKQEVRKLITNNQKPNIHETMPPDMSDFLTVSLEWDPEYRPSASELLKHDFLQRTLH